MVGAEGLRLMYFHFVFVLIIFVLLLMTFLTCLWYFLVGFVVGV